MLISNLGVEIKHSILMAKLNAKDNLKSAKLSFDYNKSKAKGAAKELGNKLPFNKKTNKTAKENTTDENIVEVLDEDGNVLSESTFTEVK